MVYFLLTKFYIKSIFVNYRNIYRFTYCKHFSYSKRIIMLSENSNEIIIKLDSGEIFVTSKYNDYHGPITPRRDYSFFCNEDSLLTNKDNKFCRKVVDQWKR